MNRWDTEEEINCDRGQHCTCYESGHNCCYCDLNCYDPDYEFFDDEEEDDED